LLATAAISANGHSNISETNSAPGDPATSANGHSNNSETNSAPGDPATTPPQAHHTAAGPLGTRSPQSTPNLPPPTPGAGGADTPTAEELATALINYYALMPGDTADGWGLLTSNFQNKIARNRSYYDYFWGRVDRVTLTDVVGRPPGSVEATVTYYFANGEVSVERTAYRMVREAGVLKIDYSAVLSAHTRSPS
jgi:hypothetical protein